MPKEEFGPLAPYCPHKRPRKDNRKYDAAGLWSIWVEYASYVNNNPIPIPKQSIYKGQVVHHQLMKYRPYIKSEFLRLAKISEKTWRNYKDVDALKDVIRDIEDIIFEQKLIGGYIDHFNTTITSQDLGMKTKIEYQDGETLEEFLEGLEPDSKED